MREVTLYALKPEKVLVTGDYLEIRQCSMNSLTRVVGNDEFIVNAPIEIQRTPVRIFQHSTWNEPLYVCWHPDVQKLLDIELENTDNLRHLEKKVEELKTTNADLQWIVDGYKNLTIMDHVKITLKKLLRRF